MVDKVVRLDSRAWAPSLPIVRCGGDGAIVEKRGLHAFCKTRECLLGIGLTGKRGAAQCPAGFDFLVTLRAPLPIDGALSLRLAMFRVEEDPALLDAPIARASHRIAIALRERSHRLWIGLGQNGLGFVQGRWNAGNPLEVGIGQLVQVLGTLEGTVSDQERHATGELHLGNLVGDDLAEVVRVTPLPLRGFIITGIPAWCSTIQSNITWLRSGR
jgi:hypothetical protein